MKKELLATGLNHHRQLEHARQKPHPNGRRQPPFKLTRIFQPPAPRLRADQEAGIIYYGTEPLLSGIPADAWRYRLGNRSALEWVLDQYKDRRPKDPTIRAQFDTYRLADHLAEVGELLAKVATVSVRTMEIVDRLAASSPLNPGHDQPKPAHVGEPPASPEAERHLLLDFSRAAEPVEPPATISLALTREESDVYLAHYQTELDGPCLECLMNLHGHLWDKRVLDYNVMAIWQGPRGRAGSWVASLICKPDYPPNAD